MNMNEIAEKFYKSVDEILLPRQNHKELTERRIGEIWGTVILHLEAFCDNNFNYFTSFFTNSKAERTAEFAILSTYTKANLVLEEIIVLMRAGYSDGAIGRARTLHELTVFLNFLIKYNGNQELIERYYDHSEIEKYKELKVYEKHCKLVGQRFEYSSYLKDLGAERKRLISKYGEKVEKDNFWYSCIEKCNNFREVETNVGFVKARIFYKRGCNAVHSSPKNNYSAIGNEKDDYNALLSGSTVHGLEIPGQAAIVSLQLMNSAMLGYIRVNHEKRISEFDEYFEFSNQIANDIKDDLMRCKEKSKKEI